MTSNSSEYFSDCILKHSHYNEEYINAKQISDNLSSLSGCNTLIIIKYIYIGINNIMERVIQCN